MIRVFLGGEGANELGGWASEPAYRTPASPGVVEALLRKVHAQGWVITGAVRWTKIRKFRAGEHRDREIRNVLGLVRTAHEAGCDVVAFVRDRDGARAHPNHAREEVIEAGILQAFSLPDGGPSIIGGVAIEKLESWLLALVGQSRSEEEMHPEAKLEALGIALKVTIDYVRVVEDADLGRLPDDARSLHRWLDRAKAVLGTRLKGEESPD